ncbi:hypothetical protein V8E51_012653 [Hyaloscypha variabilis]
MAPIGNTTLFHASFLTENGSYKKNFDSQTNSEISNILHHASTFKEFSDIDPSFKRIYETSSHSAPRLRANDMIHHNMPNNLPLPHVPSSVSARPPTLAIVGIVFAGVGLLGLALWGISKCGKCKWGGKKKKAKSTTTQAKAGEETTTSVRDREVVEYEMENIGSTEHAEHTERINGLRMVMSASEMV